MDFSYFKENFLVLLKRSIEFKINFFSFSFVSFFYFLTTSAFISALYYNFNDLINWHLEAFIFYVVFLNGSKAFLAQFSNYKQLAFNILSGNLNSFLVRPRNAFFQHMFSSSNLFGIFDFILYFGVTLVFILINLDLIIDSRFFLGLIFTIFGFIFHFIFFRFLESTAFFMKNSEFFIQGFAQPYRSFTNYPAIMFEGGIRTFAYLMPNVYMGAYLTSFIFGFMSLSEFFQIFQILISLIFIFSFLLYLFWKKGLERYEAYG